jgi:hypothetical protein
MTFKHARLAVGLAAGALLVLPAGAAAEETTCSGTIGKATVDNLRVPDNASCVLEGTKVKGTVKVESGATLRAKGVKVIGSVQGENARKVAVVKESRVRGDVQVVQGEAAKVTKSRVRGSILYDQNTSGLRIRNVDIGEDVQAFQNTGGVVIQNNTVDGNLQCKENEPPPTGGGNVVDGNKEDQCAGL